MSQHDYVIANDSGASVRADLNSALQAILSQNSGTSAPSSTASGTLWLDTTGGAPYTLKIRDAGNNHWLTIASITDPGSDGNLSMSAIEGTAVLSTGESGGSKFLREDGDGSCSFQTITPGKILQVVSTEDNQMQSYTNLQYNSFQDLLTLPITPSATSSKILVHTSVAVGVEGYGWSGRILQNGSTVSDHLGSSSSRTAITFSCVPYAANDDEVATANYTGLFSPSSTSEVTYKVQGAGRAVAWSWNRGEDATDTSDRANSVSTLTLMEVSA